MPVPTEKITQQRLELWKNQLKDEHATPLVLIGIKHDQNAGQMVICTVNEREVTREVLAGLLTKVVFELTMGRGL